MLKNLEYGFVSAVAKRNENQTWIFNTMLFLTQMHCDLDIRAGLIADDKQN